MWLRTEQVQNHNEQQTFHMCFVAFPFIISIFSEVTSTWSQDSPRSCSWNVFLVFLCMTLQSIIYILYIYIYIYIYIYLFIKLLLVLLHIHIYLLNSIQLNSVKMISDLHRTNGLENGWMENKSNLGCECHFMLVLMLNPVNSHVAFLGPQPVVTQDEVSSLTISSSLSVMHTGNIIGPGWRTC